MSQTKSQTESQTESQTKSQTKSQTESQTKSQTESQTESQMTRIWRRLPVELYYRITDYLNPALRRDLGLFPKKIDMSFFNLNLDIPIKSYKNIYITNKKKLITIEIDSQRLFTFTIFHGYNDYTKMNDNYHIFNNTLLYPVYSYSVINHIDKPYISIGIYHEFYEHLILNNVKIRPD